MIFLFIIYSIYNMYLLISYVKKILILNIIEVISWWILCVYIYCRYLVKFYFKYYFIMLDLSRKLCDMLGDFELLEFKDGIINGVKWYLVVGGMGI